MSEQTKQTINQRTIIQNGRVLDPASGTDAPRDVLIESGKIKAVDSPGAFSKLGDATVVDAKDYWVTPGLIDIHVHLREPGFEWKETIRTGTEAAVAGGFTAVCCMPNTNPVNDDAQVTQYILNKAASEGLARVYPIGCITKKQKGEELAPMLELREAGCVAFSDDGHPVANAGIMRRALEYSLLTGAVLTVHEEEKQLSEGFSMNESALSLKLGLRGMPGAAEDIMISRDIELSRLTGAPVHFCHVSTARAVTLIERAKADGINVTAETAPHYFSLTEDVIGDYDTNAKMSMPLRTEKDRLGILDGVKRGVFDCIASDHAPHELDSKRKEFAEATFGILGLQTTLPLTLELVRQGVLTPLRAIEMLTSAAAKCLRLSGGTLAVGTPADLVIIDPERAFTLSAESIRSKSKNTPYLGKTLRGAAVKTFVGGKEMYSV